MQQSNDPSTDRARVSRRTALAGGTAASVALTGLATGWTMTARARQDATPAASPEVPGKDPASGGHSHASPTAAPAQTPIADPLVYGFVQGEELVQPEIRASIDGVLETTLTAAMAPTMVAGKQVTTLTYDGSFPGPTLQIKPGETLKVQLINELDQMTNLHTHGVHVSPSGNSDNVLLTIEPGETFDYEYHLPINHPPGTYWYHPHHHGQTDVQVSNGLAGMLLIDGFTDLVPGLASYPTRLMAIQATQFDTDGVVLSVGAQTTATQMHLINGQWQPIIRIAPGEIQHWQLANVSGDNFYYLSLADHQLVQIAADGNPFDAPQPLDQLLLAPGQRADVLVQGQATPGTYAFRNLQWGTDFQMMPDLLMATVIVEGDAVTADPIPDFLVPFEDLSHYQVDRQRSFVFQEVDTATNSFHINGRPFDERIVNVTVPLNALEEWVLYNTSFEEHPFHIHVNDFQVVAVNGEPYTAHGYNDTFAIPAYGSFTMRTRFLDFTGKYVYHCHILFHEDNGMMGIVEVVED